MGVNDKLKEPETEATELNAIENGNNTPLIDLTTEEVNPVEDEDQYVEDPYDPSHWEIK